MRKQDRRSTPTRAAPEGADGVVSTDGSRAEVSAISSRRRKYTLDEYTDLRSRLSINLRELRLERGWTHAEAAAQCEMDTRFYQKIESGTLNTTFVSLARLARGFGIDVLRLLRPADAARGGDGGAS